MARARLPLPLLLLLLASAAVAVASADVPWDVCVGPIVKLAIYAPDPEGARAESGGAESGGADRGGAKKPPHPPFSVEYAVVAAFGGLPPNATSPSRHNRLRLRVAEPIAACGPRRDGGNATAAAAEAAAAAAEGSLRGAYVLASRGGNCSFADKYAYLVGDLGAAGMLVYDDRPGCVVMGAAAAAPPSSPDAPVPLPEPPKGDDDDAAPPALSLDRDRGLALAELTRAAEGAGGTVELEAWLPDLPPALAGGGWGAAASALALALMATATVVWGSVWSGRDRLAEIMVMRAGEEGEEEEEEEGGEASPAVKRRSKEAEQHHPLDVTPAGAAWFVLVASLSLLAIWILRGPVVAVLLTAAFAAGGAQGVAAWLAPALRAAAGGGIGGGGGVFMARAQRVPGWAAAALELILGLPPAAREEEELTVEEAQEAAAAGGWQALPSSTARRRDGGDAEDAAAAEAPPFERRHRSSCFYYRRTDLAAALAALSAAALWFAADRRQGDAAAAAAAAWPWLWLLQDVLAVSLLAQLLRALRLPDFRAACALLPLALLYDVFWVFVQPRLFGGDSVMVDVATGGGGGSRPLPMLLRVPSPLFGRAAAAAAALPGLPASISLGGGESLLGFGDVVLPGMLAALARRLDVERRVGGGGGRGGGGSAAAAAADGAERGAAPPAPALPSAAADRRRPALWPDYLPAVACAYAAGLALTFAALRAGVGGEGGQPALLYLSPCVLLAFAGVAWRRGELREAWARGGVAGGEQE